jgi:hypothetical protein
MTWAKRPHFSPNDQELIGKFNNQFQVQALYSQGAQKLE